jgi:hypothetical protein
MRVSRGSPGISRKAKNQDPRTQKGHHHHRHDIQNSDSGYLLSSLVGLHELPYLDSLDVFVHDVSDDQNGEPLVYNERFL